MGRRAGWVWIAVVFAAGALLALGAPLAAASTKDIIAPSDPQHPSETSGWQAGTCNAEPPEVSTFCNVNTPSQFFERASGHPDWGFTQFIVEHTTTPFPPPPLPPVETLEEPIGELHWVRVDLPVGFSVNPGATTRCPLAVFEAGASGCEAPEYEGSRVGESMVWTSVGGKVNPPQEGVTKVGVFNIVPPEGEPALFGLELAGNEVFLRSDVAFDGDYHEGFTIEVPRSLVLPEHGVVLKNRLVFDGQSGDGTFLTTPTTCNGEAVPPHQHDYSTWLLAGSYDEEEADPSYVFPASAMPPLESPIPPGTSPKECGTIPYSPANGIDPRTSSTDSPSGALTHVSMPFVVGADTQETSHTKRAVFVLPAGMSLNPSAANGLVACSDEQFGKGTKRLGNECPAASKVGTVKIESPPLPEGALEGNVYVGTPLSRDPASGNEYRIFVEAMSARYGLAVRLIGNVSADPATGQLTTTFAGLPQVPFSDFTLQLDGGPRATLTSPPTCGPHALASDMTPWAPIPDATPGSAFSLSSAPGGGSCPKTLGERPFQPGFSAHVGDTQAGAYTTLEDQLTRGDGNQELKGADITLPPGLSARLAGLTYCPDAALAAAAANSGAEERAHPSCPESSLVGSAPTIVGSGPDPLQMPPGKVFLAGPYHGAPLSLAAITPATPGPYDLGTVVARVALFVDSKTAQVRAVSDPFPHVFGGAMLDIRSILLKVDRPGFTINPTNCSAFSFSGKLYGGGSNPADPAAFSAVQVSAPFQATGCDALGFAPKLYLRAFGATKRAKNPKLRAILVARPGDANVASAAVTLPKALILDQGSISNVCTRVQFAAGQCPSTSIYGFAEATSPLLDGPLKGPVYLRSSDNTLPDLVAALRGQVDIELDSRTDTVHGRLRNTFDATPDVPVTKFVLTVRGGKKKGLLVNSQSLCAHRQFAHMSFVGQNGKTLNRKVKVRTSCRRHHHRRHRHHRRHHRGGRHNGR